MRCCVCNKFVKKDDLENVRYYDGYALHIECGDSTYARIVQELDDRRVEHSQEFKFAREVFQAYVKHMGLIGKVTISQFVDDYLRQHKQPSTKRGGARTGAGRPKIGKYRSVGMTLPDQAWGFIDELIDTGQYNSYIEYFRHLHEMNMLHVQTIKELNDNV